MKNEVWKPIKGYEGLYEVSNIGRIKSLSRIVFIGPHKENKKVLPEKILKLKLSNAGYYVVGLCKNRKYAKKTVHTIVWDTFSSQSRDNLQIDHIDGNKTNNSYDNFQLLTRRDNTSKSVKKEDKLTGAFKNGNGWTARISINNRLKNLGTYNTQEEAHRVYLECKLKSENQNG